MTKSFESLTKLGTMLIFLSLIGCNSSNDANNDKQIPSEEEKQSQISKIEKLHEDAMNASTNEEAKNASLELFTNCTTFVETFPRDPHCADFMFMAAKAANGLQKYEESLVLLDRMTRVYGNYDNLIEVYFLYAFTLDEDLNDKERAKEAYTKLMNKFPGEPLSKQAAVLIDQLYLSDEELIKRLMDEDQ